jgi:hypothetical protein
MLTEQEGDSVNLNTVQLIKLRRSHPRIPSHFTSNNINDALLFTDTANPHAGLQSVTIRDILYIGLVEYSYEGVSKVSGLAARNENCKW